MCPSGNSSLMMFCLHEIIMLFHIKFMRSWSLKWHCDVIIYDQVHTYDFFLNRRQDFRLLSINFYHLFSSRQNWDKPVRRHGNVKPGVVYRSMAVVGICHAPNNVWRSKLPLDAAASPLRKCKNLQSREKINIFFATLSDYQTTFDLNNVGEVRKACL